MSIRADLLQQLAGKGVVDPQSYGEGNIEELSPECTHLVSGGFGQQVGFGQGFGQTVGGGFTQTTFLQVIEVQPL